VTGLGIAIGWLGLTVAFSLILAAVLLLLGRVLQRVREWDRRRRILREHRRRRRGRGGYLTDDLIRQIRFFDDQWEPRS